MSDWTYERHDDARWVADNGGDDLAPYLNAALDEIERLRALQEDPDAIERAVQGMMQAQRNSTGWDTEWDEDERAWFERDARAALRAALNPEGGERTEGEQRMNAPQRYRKKPVVIEAMRLDGTTSQMHNVYQWIERNTLGSFEPLAVLEKRAPLPASGVSIDPSDGRIIIANLEGLHWADIGDWILRGVQGEFYPCKPEVFAATYAPEDGGQA